jgi:ATP-dependent helicase/nuclease subunit B
MIIPARINKGDVLGSRSSVASLEQLKLLRNYTKHLLKDLCEEILRGNVAIKPYKKKGTTSCKYCSFSSVCQFDTAREENSFRILADHKDAQVWERIGGEVAAKKVED